MLEVREVAEDVDSAIVRELCEQIGGVVGLRVRACAEEWESCRLTNWLNMAPAGAAHAEHFDLGSRLDSTGGRFTARMSRYQLADLRRHCEIGDSRDGLHGVPSLLGVRLVVGRPCRGTRDRRCRSEGSRRGRAGDDCC